MTRIRLGLLACLLFILGSTVLMWSQGQNPSRPRAGQIRGQVRTPDGRPASFGIPVYLDQQGSGSYGQTQTDQLGKFEFMQLPPAIYEVRVRLQGYREVHETVDLTAIPTGYALIQLSRDPASQEPVEHEGSGVTVSVGSLNIPDQARKDFESGKALLLKGSDLDKSVRLFKKAIAAYPTFSEAYLLMGVAYTVQQQWKEADSALHKAVELNVTSAPAYIALGDLQFQQHDYAGAEKTLLKAVELNPASPDAQFQLARAYWAMGRWQDADPHAAKAMQLKPENPDAHVMMGNILLRKRDGAGALKEFQEALRLAPDSPLAPNIRQLVTKIEAAMKNPTP
jgi:tetratricopeptide (TPR) repeat protein